MPKNHEKFHSSNGKRRIMIADDEAINRAILGEIVKSQYEVIEAVDGTDALEKIRENNDTLSLVLLDLLMPGISGLDLLKEIKSDVALKRIPVIVMTSEQKAEVESLELGANDFIPKPYPQPEVVLARILRTIELSEDRDIIELTERDVLTGLYNREYFYRYAEQFDQYHKEMDMDAMVVDINHFHMINERYGKAYADGVLKKIGEKLRELVSDSGGIVCRREADTFLVYCPHRSDYKQILESASVGLAGDDSVHNRVRLRMGVYTNVDKGIEVERRFDRAKMAADTVRNSFAKTIALYDMTLHEKELYAEQLIEDFHRAIEERQFTVFYQPKFDVRREIPVMCSAEALVRWKHPELGMISPGVFIPLFEDNGLIQELDNYVWREAAAQIRDWKERLDFSVPVSVNVSRIDMYDPQLIETLQGILKENGLSAGELLLEITESAYTQDSEQIIETVEQLRKIGFKIEMDDFGTGYSSLNMISTLPIDALKLDMQFVRNAFSERKDTRMLEVIIDIADYLSVPVIAEGVETEDQLNALKAMGCDLVQGYYFSRPVPAEEYEQFVIERKKMDLPAGVAVKMHRPDDRKDSSFGRIALALSSGFENIYYIDADDDHYVVFSDSGPFEDLQIERSGSDFFEVCRRTISSEVFLEDRSKVSLALEKQTLLNALKASGVFTMIFRRLINGQPFYYRLKSVPAGGVSDPHIVIGITNIDAEITEEEKLEATRLDSATFARIALALSQDYFSIFYVDTETDHYIEYCANNMYRGLSIEKTGEDFFAFCREIVASTVFDEDREMMYKELEKDVMMAALRESGTYTMTFRLMIDDLPTYVHMKATYMADSDNKNIVIGVSNVDAQIRREMEQTIELRTAREKANRDALTGVKSKHAYMEIERTINDSIADGSIEPFAVAVCDVNGLKTINDTLGHKAGDQYLRSCCARICHIFKHSPVFRIGGDEFVVILTGSDYETRYELMAEVDIKTITDSVSIAGGMAEYRPGEDRSLSSVFVRADEAMYADKKRLKATR